MQISQGSGFLNHSVEAGVSLFARIKLPQRLTGTGVGARLPKQHVSPGIYSGINRESIETIRRNRRLANSSV